MLQLALRAGFSLSAAAALNRSIGAAAQPPLHAPPASGAWPDLADTLFEEHAPRRGASGATGIPAWRFAYFQWWLRRWEGGLGVAAWHAASSCMPASLPPPAPPTRTHPGYLFRIRFQ
jgi:hypothetical protein